MEDGHQGILQREIERENGGWTSRDVRGRERDSASEQQAVL